MDSKFLFPCLFLLVAGLLHAQDQSDNNFNLFGDGSKSKGPTIITATDGATFDSKKHIGTFTGNVQVQDPQFSMTCDRLVVLMNKEGGGMKQADADGNVFIISVRKVKPTASPDSSPGAKPTPTITPTPEASPGASPGASPSPTPVDQKSTGKGDHATYTTIDGLIVLTGSPEVQQGGTTHIATDPSTVMHLYNDGHLKTDGPSRTIIKNNDNSSNNATDNNAPK